MNAPGNTLLIIALLALFVACCGYAAGRVHQRRETGHDREKAYRDGYEVATRRVVSLAARVIGPRRSGARGAAGRAVSGVSPAAPVSPPVSVSAVSPSSAGGGVVMAELGFPVPEPPPSGTVPEPPAVGGVSYQPFPDPRGGGETTVLPDIRDLIGGAEAAEGHRVPRPSRPTPPGAAAVPSPAVVPDSPGPAESNAAGSRRKPPGDKRAGHRATEEVHAAVAEAEASDRDSSSGRHTVPDELVRASTYRLPPDRIFRAKVPDSDSLPDEPTTRLVPKPRQS